MGSMPRHACKTSRSGSRHGQKWRGHGASIRRHFVVFGLRWIDRGGKAGLIGPGPDRLNARRVWVELSDGGFELVANYLQELADAVPAHRLGSPISIPASTAVVGAYGTTRGRHAPGRTPPIA